jgi:EAL domain-containing protein (putative c-di-GMP-specific phosphodiesterase class I)
VSQAYGDEVAALLRKAQGRLHEAVESFVEEFHQGLTQASPGGTILGCLNSEELASVRRKQAEHWDMLLSPTLTPEVHYERALHVGRVHEMVGVDLPSLIDGYGLYHQSMHAALADCGLDAGEQKRLAEALRQRLSLDTEARLVSHSSVEAETVATLIAVSRAIREASHLSDLLHGAIGALSTLDGILACVFSRPDAQGLLQIEAFGGEAGREYADAMQRHRALMANTSVDTVSGKGPAGRAWQTAEIQIADTYGADAHLRPWQADGIRLGFRSTAALPLLDDDGQSFAVMAVYSRWPGFFRAPQRQLLLRHVQQVLSHAVLRCEQGLVIPADLRRKYRQRVEEGAVRMLYQPIIDLRNGQVHHVEALARIESAQGELIMPGDFLPALGKAGLLSLFQAGLEQVCRDRRAWLDMGLDIPVAINLPPDGLTLDAYRDILFETLSRWDLPPTHVMLEILETQDPADTLKRDARIAEFQRCGIQITQDDLGSGHSSLLRMHRVPFDAVKIDQGLVRNALEKPMRALEFIHHLTALAHAFDIPVTVEGLENEGLIEAVAILGADRGQGYGFAQPMPGEQLYAWRRDFEAAINIRQPRTALGALASCLLWDRQLTALSGWPDMVETFVRTPCTLRNYLDRLDPPAPQLVALLERNRACAVQGAKSSMYRRTRQELITRLSRDWVDNSRAG